MRRFSLLLCFSLLLMLMPTQVWAGFALDVNGDGQIHLDDVVQTLLHQGAIDVNGDGQVNADDLRTLLSQTSGGMSSQEGKTGSVSGTVIDEWGNPVSGGYVSLDGSTLGAVTDSQGKFRIAGISSSVGNRLSVTKSKFISGTSPVFSVFTGSSRNLSPIRIVHQSGSVTGFVYGPEHAPLANVIVSVAGLPIATLSDATGRFTMAGVPTGQQTVIATSASGMVQSVVQVVERETVSIGTLVFPGPSSTGVTVTGGVYDPSGGGISMAKVTAAFVDAAGTVSEAVYSTSTTADGSFRLANMPGGTYVFQASADGFVAQSRQLTVTEGTYSALRFELQPLTMVSGSVFDAAGAGIANAIVSLTGDGSATATTDASGRYRFSGLQPGTYQVTVAVPNDSYAPGMPQAFELGIGQTGATIQPITLWRLSETATVTGTVYDVAGPVIANATVSLIDSTSQLQLHTTTDSEGHYRFDYVPGGQSFTLYVEKDGFVQGYLSEMVVSGGTYAVEPDIKLMHVAEVADLNELIAAKDDPSVGEIRLTHDISTMTNSDPADDALTFGDEESSDRSVLLTSVLPVTLEASSFMGSFGVSGEVILQANVGNDLTLLENELWSWQASRIVLGGIAGYSGTIERQRSASDNAAYYTYTEADGSRTAFVTSGESLQAAFQDNDVSAVYVDGYVSYGDTLTFPSRPLALHAFPEASAEVTADRIAGFDPTRVMLDRVHVGDYQPPVITGIESKGSMVTIHFDEFGSILAETGEVSNPWLRGIIFKDHNGIVVPYAASDFWSLSDTGKALTLTFAQDFAAGDLLEFTNDVRDLDYNSMNPIAWKFDGTGWSISPDGDGRISMAIDPLDPITYQNGYISAQGTASDADGDIYLNDIKLSLYSNANGQYARFDEATDNLVFDSATPNFVDGYGQMEGDNDGLFHWYGWLSYFSPLPNGTYTVVAAVYKNNEMRAETQTSLTVDVKPMISYYAGHTLPVDMTQGTGVMTDHDGTLYLVKSDLGIAFTPDALESAYADSTNAGKIARMSASMYSSDNELNTVGLATGDYNLFLVADNAVSAPVLFHLVDSPTVSTYLNPLYSGVTYPFSYSDNGAVYGYSNVEGTFYLVPASVALADVPAYIADSQGDSTKLSQAAMSYDGSNDQYYGYLTTNSLPGGTYKLYVVDHAGHIAQSSPYAGETSIRIYSTLQLPLYLIQYLAELGNTSSVSVQMLMDAGLTGVDGDHLSLYQTQLSSEDNTIGTITSYDELKAHIQSIIDTENATMLTV